MKTSLFTLSTLLLATGALYADSVKEIAGGFDKQKIAALESYLDKNPAAEDAGEAYAVLSETYLSLGEFEPIPDLLLKRYAGVSKGDDADLNMIFSEIVRPFIETSIVSSQRSKAKDFLQQMKADFSNHPQGQQVAQVIDQISGDLYLPGVGDEMKIAFTDINGKEVDLSKMQDKVVLVDFWATWCGPCVAEMPNVIETYEEYNKMGFEIVGISLDENKEALESFIKDKNMTWPQHFDGKGWETSFVQEYGIKGIPATFLIGKGGKIIASNLRGPALGAAVAKALED